MGIPGRERWKVQGHAGGTQIASATLKINIDGTFEDEHNVAMLS